MRPALSYRFSRSKSPRGPILRPLLPVQLVYKADRPIQTVMLIDSGADFSLLPRSLAKALEIPLSTLSMDSSVGISGEPIDVAWANVRMTFGQRNATFEIDLPIQVVQEGDGPVVPLLGRHPFFRDFDISFRMGFAETKGKFVISPVTRRRKDKDYA